MKLATINCEHFQRAEVRCSVLGTIDPHKCDGCDKRVPIHQPYAFVVVEIDDGAPKPEPPDNIILCTERLREEWDRQWQAKIKAAAVGVCGRALLIPRVFYELALKHRV